MDQTYLFADRGILQPQRMENVRLRVEKAVKENANRPLFTEGFFESPSLPWEVRYDNAYPNVIFDPLYQVFRCYYTLCSFDEDSASADRRARAERDYIPKSNRIVSLGYAESKDGLNWYKPKLGLVDFEGSKENNLLFRYAHGTGVFLDEQETNPAKRYKLVTKVEYPGRLNFMAVNFSEDGIHWGKMLPWPKYNPKADAHNFPFRDQKDGRFKVITRTWQDGVRLVSCCESTDFINWSEPREILRGSGFESQVYSMPVWQIHDLYLGFASMYHEGDREDENFDTVDLELKLTTDLGHFDSVAPGDFLIERGAGHYPDGSFDCGCIYASVPIFKDNKLWLYYMGGNGRHTNFRETSLGLAYLEPDRFAYYEQKQPDHPAVLETASFHFYGEDLQILFKEEGQNASVKAALLDADTRLPIAGFTEEDCRLCPEADGWSSIRFSKPLLSLENRDAQIRLQFSNCRIYAVGGELVCSSFRR